MRFMHIKWATADNRAYLASAIAFAKIQPDGWTSDTLGPLSASIVKRD